MPTLDSPLQTLNMTREWSGLRAIMKPQRPSAQDDYNGWWHALRIVGFCMSFLNSCVNPIALYCTSGIFRKHFNRYLLCRGAPSHGPRGSVSLSTSRRLNSSRKTNVSMVHRT
ncbi:unnamed protein product [Plutella xylostella]|uniref:(diamondback moth) hypothetical protein n=1 Tax=Plutella xylostella TaxID=51655 RepID=A0A8S4FPV9_PLUXY|nr:unnamed protein product [Plutella xylostella]